MRHHRVDIAKGMASVTFENHLKFLFFQDSNQTTKSRVTIEINNTYDRTHADTHISYICLSSMFPKEKKERKFYLFHYMRANRRLTTAAAARRLAVLHTAAGGGSGVILCSQGPA